ncbi:hypothetical protein NQ318_010189 [Aromia moschata]|uniref:4-coumarate--CoA ligase n=1 Tax=Aromia moschata TaxID=1265417 RepID=A0AAV8Y258_9CUCU|nr:hypothetical protein NQ318_010189 [Aromia moschata]
MYTLIAAKKECSVTGRKYSYNQVRVKSRNLGGALRKKLNLEKGDGGGGGGGGGSRAGLICTTINPIYTPAEIARHLLDSTAKALITLDSLWGLAQASTNLMKKNIPTLTIATEQGQSTPAGAISFTEFTNLQTECTDVKSSSDDVALLPYSSGTTGLPKRRIAHSFQYSIKLMSVAAPTGWLQPKDYRISPKKAFIIKTTIPNHQDVNPAVLPLFHIYGLTILSWYQLRLGCKVVTLPKFTPELYIDTIRKQKPDVLYLAPPLGYGLTETSPVILSTRISLLKNKSCVGALGLPVPNTEVKIVEADDASGTPLGPNQVGELLVRGPQVMKGYFNRPEEKNVFLDGWLRTGDMMYYNDDGFLFITGRLKELIKVKGFQVAPAELEELIRDFPNVVDSAVIGVPHEKHGEVPRAYVVPKQGAKIDEKKLREYVASQVAPYKQLTGGISVVDSIPKNASGKTLRKDLLLLYQSEINKC